MGYRSEVSITMKNEDFAGIIPFAKSKGLEVLETARSLLSCADSIRQNNNHTTLHFGWIKWYGCPEVEFITDYIGDIPHHFIRIGENNDDIETSSDANECEDMYYCAEIVRKIEFCADSKPLNSKEVLGEDIFDAQTVVSRAGVINSNDEEVG